MHLVKQVLINVFHHCRVCQICMLYFLGDSLKKIFICITFDDIVANFNCVIPLCFYRSKQED